MAAILNARREYSTDEFTWDHENRVFTAEVSDLPRFELEQVYSDALDEGICLKSAKTGRLAWFILEKRHVNRENELTHWTFVPTTEAVRHDPRLTGVKVVVFNDCFRLPLPLPLTRRITMKITVDYTKDSSGPAMMLESEKPCGLYKVTILIPRKDDLSVFDAQVRYVLAENEKDAANMGRCAAGVATYNGPEEVTSRVVASAVRVPLTITGWGQNQF